MTVLWLIFTWIYSKFDIVVGGLFPNSTFLNAFSISTPYYPDELIWCIKTAKCYPIMFSLFFIARLDSWLIVFGVGYIIGTLIYVHIQFDVEYEHRNRRDWHYAVVLTALPMVIGVNQRFYPKNFTLRLSAFYFMMAFVLAWSAIFLELIRFIKVPVQHVQVSTVSELIQREFRLAGSAEVDSLIAFDQRVAIFFSESPKFC